MVLLAAHASGEPSTRSRETGTHVLLCTLAQTIHIYGQAFRLLEQQALEDSARIA